VGHPLITIEMDNAGCFTGEKYQMDPNILIVLALLVLAITGFVFLAVTLVAVSENLEKNSNFIFTRLLTSRGLKFPLPHGDCYDHCMADARWEPAKARSCVSACGL